MKFISLFSGFGGLDLGLERSGMRCVLQVEKDEYARKVLTKYFPNVPKDIDIRTVTKLPEANVIVGGFPCQDVSNAGKRGGIDGEKSGLWKEFKRVIRLVRPEYVIVENTTGLLSRGMGRVLRDLSEIGYDAEWQTLSSKAFGKPHERQRVFIVAYPMCERLEGKRVPIFSAIPTIQPVWWGGLSESDVVRKPSLIPNYRDRITGLGNMVDVVVAEWVGTQVMNHEIRGVE